MKRPRLLTGASSRAGVHPARRTGDQLKPARGLLDLKLDTLTLQLALNGVEGDLKREYLKPRPADDGGASKDQERRHLNSPQNGVATRMAATVNILPAGQTGSIFLGLMWRYAPHRAASDDTPARQPRTRTTAAQTKASVGADKRATEVRLLLLRRFAASRVSEHRKERSERCQPQRDMHVLDEAACDRGR